MAKQLWGSICVTDIPKDKLKEANNGKKYLNVKVWINDNPDRYGNVASIQVSGGKDDPKVYIGNLKESGEQRQAGNQTNNPDDLPF